jgi:hypothetical protein
MVRWTQARARGAARLATAINFAFKAKARAPNVEDSDVTQPMNLQLGCLQLFFG